MFGPQPWIKREAASTRERWIASAILLLAFRLLANIPAANVDEEKLHELLVKNPLLSVIDLFAGGEGFSKFSLVAAGLIPYLVAQLLVQIGKASIPHFKSLAENDAGGKRLELYGTALSVPLAFLFGLLLSHYLRVETGRFPNGLHWFTRSEFWETLGVMICVTLGNLATVGIRKLITLKGFGPGEDLLLLAGCGYAFASRAVVAIRTSTSLTHGLLAAAAIGAGATVLLFYCIYLLQAKRKIPVNYPKREKVAQRSFSGAANYSPLPLHFSEFGPRPAAAALGIFVLIRLGWPKSSQYRFAAESSGWHWFTVACLIFAFTYALNFTAIWGGETESIAARLQKEGGFIPGNRPGLRTAQYLNRLESCLTPVGAAGLSVLIGVVPYWVLRRFGINLGVEILSLLLMADSAERVLQSYRNRPPAEAYAGFLVRRPAR